MATGLSTDIIHFETHYLISTLVDWKRQRPRNTHIIIYMLLLFIMYGIQAPVRIYIYTIYYIVAKISNSNKIKSKNSNGHTHT